MLKKRLVNIFQNNPRIIKTGEYAIDVFAFVSFVLWVFKIDIPNIESEALFSGVLILATLLNKFYSIIIKETEFSPSHALACGYIENFIEPLIIQLLEEGEEPKICIYTPETFDDLSDNNIDKLKAELQLREYKVKKINLKLRHGRARDILTIEKKENREWYFDFPNTLRSLIPYVEYKIDSKINQYNIEKKEQLVRTLIDEFFIKIDELLLAKKLSKYIHTTNSNLEKIIGK